MSSGKGSSKQKSYNYYGTVAAAVGRGPLDVLHAVWVDQKAIWEGTLTRGAGDYVDLTGSIDAKWVTTGGYVRLYWGTEGQSADATMAALGHPPYAGTAYIVLHKFLFGREKSSAPNVQVVVSRKPVVPTTVVAADDNWLDDGVCNPVAVLAECVLSPDGLGLSEQMLDLPSWLAMAAWCSDSTRRAIVGCAPLIDARSQARTLLADLLALCDAYAVWTAEGKLALRLSAGGEVPANARSLDARHFVSAPAYETGSVADWKTGVIVKFIDREKRWKEGSVRVDDPVASRVRGDDARAQVARPMITRREQASMHAGEWLRRVGQPPMRIKMKVPLADATWPTTGSMLLPGDRLLVDVDPLPGGIAAYQAAKVTARKDTPTGTCELTVEVDPSGGVTVHEPAWSVPSLPVASAAGVAQALVIPLAASSFPGYPAFAVLAERPSDATVGMRVLFDVASGGVFPELGQQTGFALKASLTASLAASASNVPIVLSGGASARDAYIATDLPDSEVQARTDYLLCVIANVSSGRVVVTQGVPELEFVSLVSATPTGSGAWTYVALRGRLGTAARDWTTGAQVWILPGTNLTAWRHPDTLGLTISGASGLVRLSAYTPWAEDETTLATWEVRWGDYDDGTVPLPPVFGQSEYELVDTGSGYPDLQAVVSCASLGAKIYGVWRYPDETIADIPEDVLAGGSLRGQGPLASGDSFGILAAAVPAPPGYFEILAVAFRAGRRSAARVCRIVKRATGGSPPPPPTITPAGSATSIPLSVTITVPAGTTVYVSFDGAMPTETNLALTASGSASIPAIYRTGESVIVLARAKNGSAVWSSTTAATFSRPIVTRRWEVEL